MKSDKYRMSFMGGLFARSSVDLAAVFLELKDWDAVQRKVLSENLLQARTLASSKRVCREIISRLKMLQPQELELLVSGSTQEQEFLLWIAVCRLYKFIAEFTIEILRERYINLMGYLHYEDFDVFFNRKSEWYSELEKIKPTTRNKLRQVLFKMMREVGLLTGNNVINAAILSPRLLQVLIQGNPHDVYFLLVSESEVRGSVR